MSMLSGGKPPRLERSDKGSKRSRRNPRALAIETLKEQIAACEKKIADAKDAEATVKALRVALASLEGGK